MRIMERGLLFKISNAILVCVSTMTAGTVFGLLDNRWEQISTWVCYYDMYDKIDFSFL